MLDYFKRPNQVKSICFAICHLFSDNKKESIPSERTLKDRGNCWPNASRPPWPRLRPQAWSKTNAKAKPMGQKVKRTLLLFAVYLLLYIGCYFPSMHIQICLRSALCPRRLSQAEYHEQEEIFKLRLGHLKKVMTDVYINISYIFKSFTWQQVIVVFQCFVNCTGLDTVLMPFAGGGRDPGGAGEVGASAEPAHSRTEKDPQWG